MVRLQQLGSELESEERLHEQLRNGCTLCQQRSSSASSSSSSLSSCQWCASKGRSCFSSCLGRLHFSSRGIPVPSHLLMIEHVSVAVRLIHMGVSTTDSFNSFPKEAKDIIVNKLKSCFGMWDYLFFFSFLHPLTFLLLDGSSNMLDAFVKLRPFLSPLHRQLARSTQNNQHQPPQLSLSPSSSSFSCYVRRLSDADQDFVQQQMRLLEQVTTTGDGSDSDVLVNSTVSDLTRSDLINMLSCGVASDRLMNVFLRILSAENQFVLSWHSRSFRFFSVVSFPNEPTLPSLKNLIERVLAASPSVEVLEDLHDSPISLTMVRGGDWWFLWCLDTQSHEFLLVHTRAQSLNNV